MGVKGLSSRGHFWVRPNDLSSLSSTCRNRAVTLSEKFHSKFSSNKTKNNLSTKIQSVYLPKSMLVVFLSEFLYPGYKTGNMITKTRLEKKAALSSPVKVSSSKSRVTISSSSSSSFSSAGNVTSSKALLEPSAMIAGSLHLTGCTAPLRFLYNNNIHTNLRSQHWKIWFDFDFLY